MPSDSTLVPAMAGLTTDPATLAAQRAQANEAARNADITAIKEKGFSAYVKDLEEEKIKKMREEILQAMGLSDDALNEMSPEQRSAVEKTVSEEIQRRLNSSAIVEKQGEGDNTATESRTISALSSTLASGQDVLRVLQEVDQKQTPRTGETQTTESGEEKELL
ncbi:MAG: hypothetical protein K9H25_08450 [Rhodospirillum sp.]|nr:hypothetical protein [Rhodospirillum sp.]MCF8492117.1 hypothetical protein [Rhodospirillum sp.]MCF8501165.1 hypothetical protein [Rhodospirillum sp.]